MKAVLIALCATVGLILVNAGAAQAGSGGCQCGTSVTYAPAPGTTVAQGQPATGYRTYSYQPAQSYYRSNRGSMNRMPTGGFHDAGWKIRGGR
jgi:hypothetical protein